MVVVSGDGDATAIGGNHLIHAARRNMDITLICMNNNIYGMTNGQYSPMTPTSMLATTAPYGNLERNFDLCKLVEGCGANYVARATAAHPRNIAQYIEYALTHKGFQFVDVMTQCPTYYGRRNKLGPVEIINTLKQNTILVPPPRSFREARGQDQIGEFVKKSLPTGRFDAMVDRMLVSHEELRLSGSGGETHNRRDHTRRSRDEDGMEAVRPGATAPRQRARQ